MSYEMLHLLNNIKNYTEKFIDDFISNFNEEYMALEGSIKNNNDELSQTYNDLNKIEEKYNYQSECIDECLHVLDLILLDISQDRLNTDNLNYSIKDIVNMLLSAKEYRNDKSR